MTSLLVIQAKILKLIILIELMLNAKVISIPNLAVVDLTFSNGWLCKNLKMAKKFCDCFPKTLQWLMLINTIIDQIMSSSKTQYFVLKVKPSLNFKTVCSCKKSQDYLQCLQGLFTYIYEGSKVNFKIPTKAIRYCLLCIYNGGDQLKGDTTRKLGLYTN